MATPSGNIDVVQEMRPCSRSLSTVPLACVLVDGGIAAVRLGLEPLDMAIQNEVLFVDGVELETVETGGNKDGGHDNS